MSRLAILAVGRRGMHLTSRLQLQLGGDAYAPPRFHAGPSLIPYGPGGVQAALSDAFGRYRELVLIMPVGAAVRLLAPHLGDKRTDPAVVAVDEAGAHVVALLSGHAGGANRLAREVAAAIGARPVITTAAEALGFPALDLLGQEWGWRLEDGDNLTRASAAVIDGEPVGVYQDAGETDWWHDAPASFVRYSTVTELRAAPVAARLLISDRRWADAGQPGPIRYRPCTLVVGVGCVRGATTDELDDLVQETLRTYDLALGSVRELATIDLKRTEAGITELAARHGWPVRYFTAAELAAIAPPSGPAAAVEQAVGTPAVCEPAALKAAGVETLLVPKVRTRRATVAVARVARPAGRGNLAVVGLGPGAAEELTERGRRALEAADAIVGYHGYLDLVRPWLGPKAYHGSPIGEEVERCRLALRLASEGQRVALVSSGDAGIYGTAGIVFELLAEDGTAAAAGEIEIVPGVSAAQAAAALLGAPLMSDYVTLSLSDLMTPWDVIERRLEAAAAADLVVVLYNPASGRRQTQLARAREILLGRRAPTTPVGLVRNASRSGQAITLTDLEHLPDHPVDMLTVVLIGNSATVRVGDRLVTRRGYRIAP